MNKWLTNDEIDGLPYQDGHLAIRRDEENLLLAQAKAANRLRARLEDLKQTWLAHASRIEREPRSDYADGREDATYECGSLLHALLEGGE